MNYWSVGRNRSLGSTAVTDSYVRQVSDIASEDEPLTLADDLIHSRIDLGSPANSGEQAYVESLFTAARKCVEGIIHRPIGLQEFEYGASAFPCGGYVIELPKSPLVSILSVKYTKDDGNTVTLYDGTASPVVQPTTFVIETGCDPGALFLKSGESWPTDVLLNGFPVKIRFTAGITDIPKDLMQAMRYCFAHFYENREPVTDGRVNQPFEVPKTLDFICENYKYEVYS
jgi:uncharacterized phiE125 gp8 family phage protein